MNRVSLRPVRHVVIGFGLLGLNVGVSAASPAPSAPVQQDMVDLPARTAAAARLVEIMHLDRQLESVMPQFIALMMNALTPGNLGHEDQIRQILGEEINVAIMAQKPAFMQLYRDVYARNLSLSELQAMTAFYTSDAGQSVLAKMPALTQDSIESGAAIGQKAGQAALPQILKRMQAARLQVPKGI